MISLTINAAQLDNSNNNTNSNSKANKVKSITNQSSNLVLESSQNNDHQSDCITRTGPLIINTSHNINLTIFDSPSSNISNVGSLPTLLLNNPCSPEINNNRISNTQSKEVTPSFSSYLIPIEKPEQPSIINNNLNEFEILDQKFSIDDPSQDFSIDTLSITQSNPSNDIFNPWPQKDQDIFRPYI